MHVNTHIQGGSKKIPHPENCNFSATDGDIVTKIPDFTGKRLYYKH
jgi:hypothetical protein